MGAALPLDRRQRRRQETIEQVLDVAVEVMAEQGVVGLTLGEVARRMGVRPPSLYGYFDGKNALYDALFERGWQLLLAVLRAADAWGGEQEERPPATVVDRFAGVAARAVRGRRRLGGLLGRFPLPEEQVVDGVG